MLLLQLGQNLLRPLDHLARHAGQPGHVDAVALVGRAVDDLVQEDHLVLPLADRHVQVLHAAKAISPGRSARGSAWRTACGSRRARAGARRPTRPARCRRRCSCRGRSRRGSPGSARVAVLRIRAVSVISTMNVLWPRVSSSLAPDAGEDAVGHADRGLAGGHEAADLRHQRQQRHLADVGALARHVRAGDQQDRIRRVDGFAIGSNQRVSLGTNVALRLDDVQHGMPAVDDPQHRLLDDLRPAVVPLPGQLGQGRQHVDLGQHGGGRLASAAESAATASRSSRNSAYSSSLAFSSAVEHLLLVLLQLRRDVALGVLDRLLADVVGGDLLAVGVGDLDVVAEDLVEADLQVGDAGPLGLLGLVAGDPLLAAVGQLAQRVELGAEAVADEAAVAARPAGSRRPAPASSVARNSGHRSIAASSSLSSAALSGGELRLHRRQRAQRAAQKAQVARAGPAGGHAGQQPLDVVDAAQASRAGRRTATGSPTNSSTASSRARIAAASVSGLATQSASSREPIAVTVRSSTPSSEPSRRPSRMVRVISRLRRLASSISSVPEVRYGSSRSMCASELFCVSAR